MVGSSVLSEFGAISSHGEPIHIIFIICLTYFSCDLLLLDVFFLKNRSRMAFQVNPSCRKDS